MSDTETQEPRKKRKYTRRSNPGRTCYYWDTSNDASILIAQAPDGRQAIIMRLSRSDRDDTLKAELQDMGIGVR
jgi:hypothetical protein